MDYGCIVIKKEWEKQQKLHRFKSLMQPKAFEQLLHIENHLIEDTVFMKTGYTMQDF